jgi:hypothetical protein
MYKYPVIQKDCSLKTVRGISWTKHMSICENKKKYTKKNENNENPQNMHTFGICTYSLKKK